MCSCTPLTMGSVICPQRSLHPHPGLFSRKPALLMLTVHLVKKDTENRQSTSLPRARRPKQKPEPRNDHTARVQGLP